MLQLGLMLSRPVRTWTVLNQNLGGSWSKPCPRTFPRVLALETPQILKSVHRDSQAPSSIKAFLNMGTMAPRKAFAEDEVQGHGERGSSGHLGCQPDQSQGSFPKV